MRRIDDDGCAYAGSQLQIQIYVNRRQDELSRSVINAVGSLPPDAQVVWKSPLEGEKFAEYRDLAFLRAIEVESLWQGLKGFWPRMGPVWDGLAVIVTPDRDSPPWGVVLVEAKSYPAEIYGAGCQASSKSRQTIESALKETQEWLGLPSREQSWPFWVGPLYQTANRLAHLHFFRREGIRASLLNVYFLNDPHSPTTLDEWNSALPCPKAQLGVKDMWPECAVEVFLEARERSELC
jgi:hypothetical protein